MPRLPPVTSAILPRTLNSSSPSSSFSLVSRERQFQRDFPDKRHSRSEPPCRGKPISRRRRRRPRKPGDMPGRSADTAPLPVFLFLFDGAADLLETLLHSVLNDLQGIGAGPLNELCDVAGVPDRRLERLFGKLGLLGGCILRALELEVSHHRAGLSDRLFDDLSLLHRQRLRAFRCSFCRTRQRVEILAVGFDQLFSIDAR